MRYHNITMDDMLNGEGLRVVLWVSGCNHGCPGCQNPLTWDAQDGLVFDETAKEELFEKLSRDYISGITFSGGDPLYPSNQAQVIDLIEEIRARFPKKTIWLYTGASWEDLCHEAFLQDIDILVDGEFRESEKDNRLLWKGSANQRVIDVAASLKQSDLTKPILYCGDYE